MIECKIEYLCDASQTACVIAVPAEKVGEIVVQCAALHIRKVRQIRFEDRSSGHSAAIIREDKGYVFRLDERVFPVTRELLAAVVAMLTDTAMYGWVNTAHIDAELDNGKESADVCFKIEAPLQQGRSDSKRR